MPEAVTLQGHRLGLARGKHAHGLVVGKLSQTAAAHRSRLETATFDACGGIAGIDYRDEVARVHPAQMRGE